MDFSRQEHLLHPNDIRYPVTIIGAGGIGSWTALQLAKCGYPRIVIWDDDRVEAGNCPNQVYRPDQVGDMKVEALAEIVMALTETELNYYSRKFTATDTLKGMVVVGVDSMAARKLLWSKARNNPSVPIYIDARMARESGRVYTINPLNPDEADFYETTLYSDEEASPVPCTERAIIHNVWAINALIGSQLKKFLKGGELAQEVLFELGSMQWIYRSHRGQVLANS